MERSSMFRKGQIWYWEDPIAGKKDDGYTMPIGEAAVRFSRYVLIVQDPDTIGSKSVLVAPISSKISNSEYDVKCHITKMYCETTSYIRTASLMPVHPAFLKDYICTVSNDTMETVDGCILKILAPYVIKAIRNIKCDPEQILSVNLKNESSDITLKDNFVKKCVKEFMQDCVTPANSEVKISAKTLKNFYDRYCNDRDIVHLGNCDLIQFINEFLRLTTNKFISARRINYANFVFKGINVSLNKNDEKPADVPEIVVEVTETDNDDSINTVITNNGSGQETLFFDEIGDGSIHFNAPNKWTAESKKLFIQLCETNGVDEAAKQFNISTDTAKNYYAKWSGKTPSTGKSSKRVGKSPTLIIRSLAEKKKYLAIYFQKGVESLMEYYNISEAAAMARVYNLKSKLKLTDDDIEELKKMPLDIEVGNAEGIQNNTQKSDTGIDSITKITTGIMKTLQNISIYDYMSDIVTTNGNKVSKLAFYDTIYTRVFYSIIDTLAITKSGNTYIIPDSNVKDKYIGTWNFLDKLSTDPDLAKEIDGETIMKLYRNKYHDLSTGITSDIIDHLRRNISERFTMKPDELDFLLDTVKQIFCDR